MTTTDDRSDRSTCPSWCEAIHGDGDVEPGLHRGLRWSPVRADDGYWVDVATVQNKDGDVVVWVNADPRANRSLIPESLEPEASSPGSSSPFG